MESAAIRTYLRPSGHGLKLHLGCGDYWFEGYVNIDIEVYGGTDMCWNLLERLPFQDKTVEIIESYEVIEHVDQDEAKNMIDDWYRLLIDGGKVRISTPDMDALVSQYEANKEKTIEFMFGFTGYQKHKWIYTAETLKKLFEDKGFKQVVVTKGFLDERPNEPKLILEATK